MSKMREMPMPLPFMVQSFLQQRLTVPMSPWVNRQTLSHLIHSELYSDVNFLEASLGSIRFGRHKTLGIGKRSVSKTKSLLVYEFMFSVSFVESCMVVHQSDCSKKPGSRDQKAR